MLGPYGKSTLKVSSSSYFHLPLRSSNGGLELAGLKMLGNSVSGLKAHAGKLPILLISIMLLSMTT